MKKSICVFLQTLFLSGFIFAQYRTLDELFPGTDAAVLKAAQAGGYSHSIRTADGDAFTIKPSGEISASFSVTRTSPSNVIESLLIIKTDRPVTKLDIYNALHRISALKGREYPSSTRGRSVALFEEASIIAGENDPGKLDDPPPATSMPRSETVFIAVKDVNFGNCYYRAEINTSGRGIRYSLSNFKSINYFFMPVIKPQGLLIETYIEPVDGGVLLYGLAVVSAAAIAEKNADIPSSITKRLDVIYGWIGDNIRR
ncbi:MAG: hypothetical protein LBH50_03255 [Spirochaetaceae bacterium]|jgi:hypothetical protein|nr:hypothetical protein [Spirochaetaceae bacterium]